VGDDLSEFKGMIKGILADDEVNYREVYEFLYWLEDHNDIAKQYKNLYTRAKEMLEDECLDYFEATEMELLLSQALKNVEKS
jgi:hypothetical protein